MKKTTTILAILSLSLTLWAGGQKEMSSAIATTSWTAAFADLAGVETTVLAPFEMQHPAEYELKPTDIAAVGKAEMIIFAGYEVMVGKIKETAGSEETQMIQIATTMAYPVIEESVLKIAQAAGTEEKAGKNLEEMKTLLESSREELEEAGIYGKKAIVHFHQQAFAGEMGFEIVGTYGPGPLEANQIGELSKREADLIIDNWHNPVSQPLQEIFPDLPAAELINFPGHVDTETLLDVVKYNVGQLTR